MPLSTAYANGAFIPDAETYPPKWADAAEEFRKIEDALGRAMLNQRYGDHPREEYDLFLPNGPAKGTLVFIHGGYWMAFGRESWSHLAAGPQEHGWAVMMPSYPLAPDAPIAAITQSVVRAIVHLAAARAGEIRITGHSAGGHLAARMVMDGVLPDDVAARVTRAVPISPVGDLLPLLKTDLNTTLGLNAADAIAESPVHGAKLAVDMTVWVGGDERPVFLEEARGLSRAWDIPMVTMPNQHHFNVIEPLADAHSALTLAIIR